MTKYAIKDTTLSAMADNIRNISGETKELTTDNMIELTGEAVNNINEQVDIIEQIKISLQGKAAGNGDGGITPSGIKNITENGIHDVTLYEKANVNVPIPDGYIQPSGTMNITENGTHDATEYASVKVEVPVPDGYLLPAGVKTITENGNHGVAEYAGVIVDVPSKEPVILALEITENGTYTTPEGVDGYSPITVNVPSSGGGDTDLPEGYKRADYIQFTGKQVVDSDIICNRDTKIRVVFTREKSSQHYMYGVASSDNTASVTAYLGGSWRFGNKSATKTIDTNEDMIYSGVVDNSQITTTRNATTISGVNEFETIGSLLIGTCRSASGSIGSPQFEGKMLLFEICQVDESVLKLIPVTDGNGTYRFWNTVGRKFHDSTTDTPLQGGNF